MEGTTQIVLQRQWLDGYTSIPNGDKQFANDIESPASSGLAGYHPQSGPTIFTEKIANAMHTLQKIDGQQQQQWQQHSAPSDIQQDNQTKQEVLKPRESPNDVQKPVPTTQLMRKHSSSKGLPTIEDLPHLAICGTRVLKWKVRAFAFSFIGVLGVSVLIWALAQKEKGWMALFSIVICLHDIGVVVALYLGSKRRREAPAVAITARSWNLLAVQTVGNLIVSNLIYAQVMVDQSDSGEYPCIFVIIRANVFFSVYMGAFCLRGLRLIMAHAVNHSIAQLGKVGERDGKLSLTSSTTSLTTNEAQARVKAIQRQKRMLSPKRYLVVVAVLTAVHLVMIPMAYHFGFSGHDHTKSVVESSGKPTKECQSNSVWYIGPNAVLLLLSVVVLIGWIWNKKDAYGLRTEIYVEVAVWVAIAVGNAGFRLEDEDFQSELTSIVVGCFLSSFFSLVLPVKMSLIRENADSSVKQWLRKQTSDTRIDMREILDDEEEKKYFAAFLERQFALENFAFYVDLQATRETASKKPEKILSMILDIYTKYIPDESPMQLNLTHATRVSVEEEILKIRTSAQDCVRDDIEIFAECEDHILGILLSDSWPRFVQSEECAALVARRDAQEELDRTINKLYIPDRAETGRKKSR